MGNVTRREMLGRSSLLAAALGSGLPLNALDNLHGGGARKLKIVAVGAHPDDPESGCGGTLALYADQGHSVAILYLTRGEAGIQGSSLDQAGAIRTAESRKACGILNARAVYAGQTDGNTELNRQRYEDFRKLLESEEPDIVFTHWPVDTHRDHRAASLLAYDAWIHANIKFDLYYFEVEQGEQTQLFHPTHYVDIAPSLSRKQAACFAHVSQQPLSTFWPIHEQMHRFRGMECGVKDAEAFVRHCRNAGKTAPLG